MIGTYSISDLPAVKFDGIWRVLGCIPETEESKCSFASFSESFQNATALDPSSWQEIDLSWYNPPVLDQGATSSCFPAGVMVRMADGSKKPIEQIVIGDEVITHTGKSRKVVDTFKRLYSGVMRIVYTGDYYDNMPNVPMTYDHKMAVIEDGDIEWIQAGDIVSRSNFLIPFDTTINTKKLEKNKYGYSLPSKWIGGTFVEKTPVYDFEVEEDHSFIANGLVSSNCVGHGACTGMEFCWMQSGKPLLEFNPYFIYGLINGGRDQGAMISDALRALQQYGVCLKGDLPRGVMFRNQFPQKAFDNASRFKLLKAFRCDSFEDICSAISLGFVCVLGIYVGANFSKVDSEYVCPVPNRMDGGGHCQLPNSIIFSPEMKKAKDVKVGDDVYGHDGKKHKVTEVFTRNYSGSIAHIMNRDGNKLSVTDGHPVLIYRNKKKYTYTLLETTLPSIDRSTKSYVPVWVRARDVIPGDFLVTPKLVGDDEVRIPSWIISGKEVKKLPPLTVDKDLAWLFGYYIGNGNVNCQKCIEFSIPLDGPVEKIKSIMYEKFGLIPTTYYRTTNGYLVDTIEEATSIKLRFFSAMLTRSFRAWFGGYSHEKRIPSWMFYGWDLESLFAGLMASDGCEHKKYRMYNTTSEILAEQVSIISSTLGYKPSKTKLQPSKSQYKNAREYYNINWTVNGKYSINFFVDDNYLKLVKNVYFTHYDGEVYNYEVEDCHSYLVDGMSVHNCILGMELKKSQRYGWKIGFVNSWGKKFGKNGYAYIHKEHFRIMNPDAFAIQLVSDDPQDNTPEDEVPVVTGITNTCDCKI